MTKGELQDLREALGVLIYYWPGDSPRGGVSVPHQDIWRHAVMLSAWENLEALGFTVRESHEGRIDVTWRGEV